MGRYVTKLRVRGLHGRFDLEHEFLPGVNILYGRNGTGKTTLLHILANALDSDFTRFAFLDFDTIEVDLDGGEQVRLARLSPGGDVITVVSPVGGYEFSASEARQQDLKLEREFRNAGAHAPLDTPTDGRDHKPIVEAAYFPAFRTMLDARSILRRTGYYPRDLESNRRVVTSYVRESYGRFVPAVSYPSLREIERSLSQEVYGAWHKVAQADSEQLASAFVGIFAELVNETADPEESSDELLTQIERLSEAIRTSPFEEEAGTTRQTYVRLREMLVRMQFRGEPERTATRVLRVYRDSLLALVEARQQAYAGIMRYFSSVNEFFDGKELHIAKATPRYPAMLEPVRFTDGGTHRSLRVLSSGEREIAALIYAATHMSRQSVVLIDEPEISLHVDWQRRLIPEMVDQLGARQIVACTHSPIVGRDYEDRMSEVCLVPTSRPRSAEDQPRDEEEELL